MTNFSWKVKKTNKSNKARTGKISTPHGDIETPAFIFCATKAALKSFTTLEAKKKQYTNYTIQYLPFNASARQ